MKNTTILILDKNPVHRNLLSYRLVSGGFKNVHLFTKQEELKYRLEKLPTPDFIIVDYSSVTGSNFDFIDQIKLYSKQINIIYFTSEECDSTATQLLEHGASDYILKTSSLSNGISELIKNLKYIISKVALTTQN